MPEPFFEPLSAMDRQFLEAENASTHMHVSGISRFDVGRLRSETGGLDSGLIAKAIEGILGRIPRYRQKLAWTPIDRPRTSPRSMKRRRSLIFVARSPRVRAFNIREILWDACNRYN